MDDVPVINSCSICFGTAVRKIHVPTTCAYYVGGIPVPVFFIRSITKAAVHENDFPPNPCPVYASQYSLNPWLVTSSRIPCFIRPAASVWPYFKRPKYIIQFVFTQTGPLQYVNSLKYGSSTSTLGSASV